MKQRHEHIQAAVIDEDAWGHPVVPGISMDLPDGFEAGDKVRVTIIVEKSE